MNGGPILFKRKAAEFKCSFYALNNQLPNLLKYIDILHIKEAEYCRSLKFDRRKKSYLLGRIASKHAVLELLQIDTCIQSFSIEFGVFHFPVVKYLTNQNIQVSISHCDQIGIAIAFPEKHPLGIDIERICVDKIATIKSSICKNEFKLIESIFLPLPVGGTLIWSIKESLSKVLRTGLTTDFQILEIKSIEKNKSTYISLFKLFIQYKAVSCQIGDYFCTVVMPKNSSCNLDFFWKSLEIIVSKKQLSPENT